MAKISAKFGSVSVVALSLLVAACDQTDPEVTKAPSQTPLAPSAPADQPTVPAEPLMHASAPAASASVVVAGELWRTEGGVLRCVVNADNPSGFQQWQFELTGPKAGQKLRLGFDVPSEPGERPVLSAFLADPPQQAVELTKGQVWIERYEPTSAGARVGGKFSLSFADSALPLRDGSFAYLDCQ